MSYKALYRVFRPKCFAEVVGQNSIIQILQNQITNNQISHAYLFTGSRGTGKTSVAKIFARAVSCPNTKNGEPCGECKLCKDSLNDTSVDIIEIDAASNNGVDEIRDLRDKVKFAPVNGKYKVYIIDEVHMLSSGAFNALLKTLEEPPEHAIFILATTEPHKLPDTIISRCQRYDFNRIPTEIIVKQLQKICDIKEVQAEKEALTLLASYSEGGLRDAISLLDQCIVFGNNKIEKQTVRNLLGISSQDDMFKLADSLLKCEGNAALLQIETRAKMGKDISILANDIISHFRQLMVYKTCENPLEILSPHYEQDFRRQSEQFSMQRILEVIDKVSKAQLDMRYATIPIIFLELAIMKLCLTEESVSVSSGNIAKSVSTQAPVANKSVQASSENIPPWQDSPAKSKAVGGGAVVGGTTSGGTGGGGTMSGGTGGGETVNGGAVGGGTMDSTMNGNSITKGAVSEGAITAGTITEGAVREGKDSSPLDDKTITNNYEEVPPWEESFEPPLPQPPMEPDSINSDFVADSPSLNQALVKDGQDSTDNTYAEIDNKVGTVVVPEKQITNGNGEVDKKVYSELLQRIKKGNKSLYTMMNQGFWAGFSDRKLTIGFPGEECEVFMQAVDKRKDEISKYLAEMGFSDIKIYVTMSNVDSKQAAIDLFGKDNITIIE